MTVTCTKASNAASLTAASASDWIAYDNTKHLFTGTPTSASSDYTVKCCAEDTGAVAAARETYCNTDASLPIVFKLTTNNNPVLANALAGVTFNAGVSFTYQLPLDTFSDADDYDELVWSYVMDSPVTFTGTALSWETPSTDLRTFKGKADNTVAAETAAHAFTITVTDQKGGTVTAPWILTINDVPVVATAVAAKVFRVGKI
jgi:hypothetical protein